VNGMGSSPNTGSGQARMPPEPSQAIVDLRSAEGGAR
jgi:hypothetical protein